MCVLSTHSDQVLQPGSIQGFNDSISPFCRDTERFSQASQISQASQKKYAAILLGETSLFLLSNQVFVEESRGQTAAGPCLLGYLAQRIGSVPDAKMDENRWEDDGKLMGIWWEYDGKLMEIWSEYVAKAVCGENMWELNHSLKS